MRGYTRSSSLSNLLFLYNFLLILLIPLILIVSLINKRVRRGIRSRFFGKTSFEGDCILMHASSLGEAKQAVVLSKMLRKITNLPIIFSTFTLSGYEFAKNSTHFDDFFITPYDLPLFIDIKLSRINPIQTIFVEGDLWLNLLYYLHRRDSSIIIVSGRVSESGFKRYGMIRSITRVILSMIGRIYPVNKVVEERYRLLGYPGEDMKVMGSLKYGMNDDKADIDRLRREINITADDRLLAWGSFHRGEVGFLCDVIKKVNEIHPDVKSIVAPRYLDDVERFATSLKDLGFDVGYRTDKAGDWDILILDTLGELSCVYSLGDIAIVGGTFIDRGGQNIVEPALKGVPVLFGEDIRNFREEAELLNANGGIMVSNVRELSDTIVNLLNNDEERVEIGRKALESSIKLIFDREEFLKDIEKWI